MSQKIIATLGRIKDTNEIVCLYDFEWSCGWYWSGGYVGNKKFHTHFDSCFLKVPDYRGHSLGNFPPEKMSNGCAIWEDLEFFLDRPNFTKEQWWRMKDLFKQFYVFRSAAECFRHGGHCTSKGRNEKEIDKEKEDMLNAHIKDVIIPQIRELCDVAMGRKD